MTENYEDLINQVDAELKQEEAKEHLQNQVDVANIKEALLRLSFVSNTNYAVAVAVRELGGVLAILEREIAIYEREQTND